MEQLQGAAVQLQHQTNILKEVQINVTTVTHKTYHLGSRTVSIDSWLAASPPELM